jgi:hypothetical protein
VKIDSNFWILNIHKMKISTFWFLLHSLVFRVLCYSNMHSYLFHYFLFFCNFSWYVLVFFFYLIFLTCSTFCFTRLITFKIMLQYRLLMTSSSVYCNIQLF